MKWRLSILASACLATGSQAVTFLQWNFNSVPNDNKTTTGTTVPSVNPDSRATTLSLIGATAGQTGGFQFTLSSGSNDPQTSDNSAFHTSLYPAQGTGSGTSGFRAMFSTVGFYNITVQFDVQKSASASRWTELQYTYDGGTTWTPVQDYETPSTVVTFVKNNFADLSALPGAAQNPNFGFQLVSIFGNIGSTAGATQYMSVGNTSTPPSNAQYGTTGTARYDWLTIGGTAVPEPTGLLPLSLGLLALKRRRRS